MQTTVIFKTDKKRKQEAQQLAKKMGIPFSAVMNAYLQKFIEEQRIEFMEPLMPTPYLKRILKETDKELAEGKVKFFSSVDELLKDLKK